jgi:hypothetical protein
MRPRDRKRIDPPAEIGQYGAGSLAEEARDAGARHIFPKPVDFPRLLALVELALSCVN